MGRKLDLSGLTDNEAEHVLQVVQRDMRLRKKEEERLSELKQELDDEGSRCLLLSRQGCFNQRCCIRCCSPFTFLLNPRRRCRDCRYNVCKACRVFNKRDGAWLCCACQKSRLLKTQSLEWFYTNVKKRFKRFGSAKVLKTLYRKHLAEHSALSELTEGSAYEESICNEGSISESDSTFYRQSEEHSMAETLSVALRVAEEAIDEAISKAEFDPACQKKQNEAHYLREHRTELVEELAKTIVQKIISRRKTLAEMRAEYNQEWPLEQNTGPHRPLSSSDQASSSLQHQAGLWRSHSAFSLSANDPPSLIQDSSLTLKKEGAGSAMSAWKSVDRLDNAGVSSVLKSPDGNWIALQSAQLSRPSLLTKRKSPVYSALERESGVVSAYEGMGSDNEAKPELDGSWGAVLQEIHRKMTDSNLNLQDARERVSSALMGRHGSREEVFSDSEGNRKSNKPLLAFFKRKLPAEIRRPSSSRRTSIIDVNFNVERAGEEQQGGTGPEPEVGKVRRSRRKRRSKKEQVASSAAVDFNRKDNQPDQTSDTTTPDTLTSGATTPDPLEHKSDVSEHVANQMEEQQPAGRDSDCSTRGQDVVKDGDADDDRQRMEAGEEDEERLWKMEIDEDEDRTKDEEEEEDRDLDPDDEDMKERLYRLVAQSRLTYFSSTDEELNKLAQGEGKWEEDKDEDMEDEEETTERLTHRLCQLEKDVRASQFSSTEDELDRAAADEEELAVKVCRLADQVDATQFSSTEDELDAADRGGEEEEEEEEDVINEQTLWTLQTEKTVQAAQLRDLASLVSASQFSSTEDELDRVGENEGALEQEVQGGGTQSCNETEEGWGGEVERRESFGDLDEKMFDLRDETEEPRSESSKDVTDDEMKTDAQRDEMNPEKHELLESAQAGETKDEKPGEEKLEDEAEGEQGAEEMEAEKEINETVVEDAEQPKWTDGDGQREEKFEKSSESQAKRETMADSYEDNGEFDRIISSMLMMTLDDMQVEPSKEEAAEVEKTGGETFEDGGGERSKDGGGGETFKDGGGETFKDGGGGETIEDGGGGETIEDGGGGETIEDGGGETIEDGGGETIEDGGGERIEDGGGERLEDGGGGETSEDGGETSKDGGGGETSKDGGGGETSEDGGGEKFEGGGGETREDGGGETSEDGGETSEDGGGETFEGGGETSEDGGGETSEDGGSEGGSRAEESAVDQSLGETEQVGDESRDEERSDAADGQEKEGTSETRETGQSWGEEDGGEAAAEAEGVDEEEGKSAETEQSSTVPPPPALLSPQDVQNGGFTELHRALDFISTLLEQRYSAASLRSITTEVLKVLNATEDLLQGAEAGDGAPPPGSDPRRLDRRFSRLEENVYVAAGSVYGLEAELSDLEECARGICSSTSNMELSYLEEQVASAAAKVQQSELQISDISARIAALKNAGLNVDAQSRFRTRTVPVMPVTLDSSRQLRRRLPAPPGKDDKHP